MILFLPSFGSYNSSCCKVHFSAIGKITILMGCVEIVFLCVYFSLPGDRFPNVET